MRGDLEARMHIEAGQARGPRPDSRGGTRAVRRPEGGDSPADPLADSPASFLDGDQELCAALRALPRPSAKGLTTSLRVMASRERQRRVAAQQGWWSRVTDFSDRLSLHAGNVMGPIVLPLTGGVFSAVVLFGVMLSIVPVHASTEGFDVPTMLTTEAGVKGAAPICAGDDGDVIVVDISLDGQGRMVDYTIVSGAAVLQNAALRRRLENILLFTEFVPATTFGQPTTSRLRLMSGFGVRLPPRSSRIEVKG